MELNDFRLDPSNTDQLSFYVVDNLQAHQLGDVGRIYRMDTPHEAIAAFSSIRERHPDWTIALGGSLYGVSEIDFIHQINGDSALLTDRFNFPHFCTPEVNAVIEEMATKLGVEWQRDDHLVGEKILMPYLPGDEPLDRYLARMELRPPDPENVLTSINEAYVEGHGWCDRQELHELSKSFGYFNPECPRVSRLNVAFVEHAPSGSRRTGYVDISPSDFQQMKDAYILDRGLENRDKTAGHRRDSTEHREEKSVKDLTAKAKERAHEKNLLRPEPTKRKGHKIER